MSPLSKIAEMFRRKAELEAETHSTLSNEQLNNIWASVEKADAERKERYPDSATAIATLFNARHALITDHGWCEGIYCPKDGSFFAIITPGSTGIFGGYYLGEWPDGEVIVADETAHPSALLFKPIDNLTNAERSTMERCNEGVLAYIERLGRSFGDQE